MLQAEARLIAEKLHQPEFKASNGWPQSFKTHFGLKQLTVSGEAADVSQETIHGWFERLKVLIQGYQLENIWNEDETGCFYRALPSKTLAEKRQECRGEKRSKERLTEAFFANAAGDEEPPVVIGKATKPRCFIGLRNLKKPHGIPYHSNTKAWMNNEIMTTLLATLNTQLLRTGRKILLLIDNVSSHDPALQEKFSNIKVVFLPINATAIGCWYN